MEARYPNCGRSPAVLRATRSPPPRLFPNWSTTKRTCGRSWDSGVIARPGCNCVIMRVYHLFVQTSAELKLQRLRCYRYARYGFFTVPGIVASVLTSVGDASNWLARIAAATRT